MVFPSDFIKNEVQSTLSSVIEKHLLVYDLVWNQEAICHVDTVKSVLITCPLSYDTQDRFRRSQNFRKLLFSFKYMK